mgnify:CR=1 FL=1
MEQSKGIIRDVATGQAQLQPSIAMKVIHEFDRASEGAVMNQLMSQYSMRDLLLDFDQLRRGMVPERGLITGGDDLPV